MGLTATRRAVVIGAGIAGLLAARTLSEVYQSVVVVDRDALGHEPGGHEPGGHEPGGHEPGGHEPRAGEPGGGQFGPRRGVPQGHHAHGLLARGRDVMEELFPGLTAELVVRGVAVGDILGDFRWYHDGRLLCQADSHLIGLGVTRPLLEGTLRRRLRARSGVEIVEDTEVLGLEHADSRVTGVRLRPLGTDRADQDNALLPASLVVDATGRGSRTPLWLAALGYPKPAEERITVRISYVSRLYRREPHQVGGGNGALIAPSPANSRAGVALAVEGNRWLVSLVGMLRDTPPTEPAALEQFAASLPVSDLVDLIREAAPVGRPVLARFPASVRRRYERLRRFPEGYLVTGDASCCFNPLYAQGMTVAAVEALVLRDCLAAGSDRLAHRFFRRAARFVDIPWTLAAHNDLRFPGVEGRLTIPMRVVNSYIQRLHAAAARDPALGTWFLRVVNLLERPERLLAPDIALRVLFGTLRRSAPSAPRAD